MSINNKDNTLRGARNVGKLGGSRRIVGLVGAKDKIDFAKFTLSEISDFGLTLGRASSRSSAKLTLRDSRGAVLTTLNSGIKARVFKTKLVAGIYYLGMQRLRGEVSYSLAASAKKAEPGEILSTARDIGILAGTYANQEFVGTTDPVDLYKFTTNDVANLQARVSSSSAATRVELIRDGNSNGLIDEGEILVSDTDFSTPYLSSVTEDLPPGTYFIRVAPSSSSGSTPYQLDLVATLGGGSLSPEPGNTLPVARDLGVFSGTFTAKEYIGKIDASDTYKFTLNDIANLQINVKGSSTAARVRLIRDGNNNGLIDNNETLASDTTYSSTLLSSVTQDLPAGTYFVSVDPRSTTNSTLYDLNLVATPFGGNLSSDPGNTLPTARDLGVLSGTFSAKEHIGLLDSDDFYKFTVNTAVNLQVKANGSSAATLIQLIQDANSNGLIDNSETLASDTTYSSALLSEITENVQAGSYFVRVSPRSSSASTNYSLSLTV